MSNLLTPREAAALLGYRSTSTLPNYDAVLQPVFTLGGQRRYERAKIEAMLRQSRAPQRPSLADKMEAALREIRNA